MLKQSQGDGKKKKKNLLYFTAFPRARKKCGKKMSVLLMVTGRQTSGTISVF
jgi:hypothetical protein